jgi:hypothetical protein
MQQITASSGEKIHRRVSSGADVVRKPLTMLHTRKSGLPMILPLSARLLAALGALVCAATLVACTDDADEPTATRTAAATAADPKGRPITDDEIARIVGQPGFEDNRETVAEQGGEIDLAGGLVYTYADGLSGTETRFAVSTLNSDAPALDDLVFQQVGREPSFFYFAAEGAAGEPQLAAGPSTEQSTGADTSGLFGCGPWSSWTSTGTHCGNHFWCFGQSQRGTYATFTRSRQCRRGIQVANRTNFVGCGC